MATGRPSRTALQTAMRRAAHQIFDRPLVFDDPLALRIVGPEIAEPLRLNFAAAQAPLSLRLRAHIVARAQFAEDALAGAARRGVRQLVILGAGLDTTAYRSPVTTGMRVVEVDETETQAWKRSMLEHAGIPIPSNVSFLAVDFERQRLADALFGAGLDPGLPIFFSCFGVMPFLTPAAAMELLKSVGAMSFGTEIVFDYIRSTETLTAEQRDIFEAMAERVAMVGEPWRSFFDPAFIDKAVRDFGFNEVENYGADAINGRYFANRSDGLRTGPLAQLMRAKI
jgi:methyltransferase (TIGR00027 family)